MIKNKFNIYLFIATFILYSCIMLNSCSTDQKNVNETLNLGSPIKFSSPIKTDLTEYINLNANTFFLNKQLVRSTFQGFIETIYKNKGDAVKIGDELFVVKTKESMADDSLKIKFGNKLFKGTVVFKAQVNGILTQLNYNVGDFVTDGEEIAIISNPSSLRINLNVPYQYVSRINRGARCLITMPDGNKIGSSIQKIIPSVDPLTQTQTFILDPDGKENLPENLNVIARLPLRIVRNAIALPKNSILSNETLENFWVMKLINDTTAVRVNIIKGIENDSLVQIIKPALNLNDKIISDGGFGLPDTASIILQ